MTYLDVYYSRLNHDGETIGERVTKGGIRTFQRWKAESPHTVPTLSVERGLYFDGIILQSKDKAYEKILHLNVSNDIPIKVGDIMNWTQPDGSLEKWLLLSEEKKVNGTYRTFDILKCNYLIKWINDKGYLKQSWAYVLSSTDDKVKGNFRTWHNLITPQPNKYAEIIMPRPIDTASEIENTVNRGTNFIIEDESWKMVEADFTSVQGIFYMSLTENKVNFQYDDLVVDVADTDKLKFPTLNQVYNVGDVIIPNFTDETLNEWEVALVPPDGEPKYVDFENGRLKALLPGKVILKMRLKNIGADDPRKAVTKEFEITIKEAAEKPLYIHGPNKVKLDRYANYYLIAEGEENPDDLERACALDDAIAIKESTTGSKKDNIQQHNEFPNVYVFHANAENKLGNIVLTATYQGKEYTKTIEIIPLW